MPSAEVGTAHVTVYPQTDGNFGSTVGKQMETGFSAKSVAIGNIVSSAIMRGVDVALSFVTDSFAAAFNNAADYEQLIGGVETMFKGSSDIVKGYAMEAYATAGMSANEYMTQVTGFSASLIQALDGDTERAAKDADMAIRDMSDNANKMGTDMESITNAYQGFAKQNYTMLDNLKLGYGGTKSEMERLLADAEKISGVHYDLSNYDDVIQAIHVMQTEMGISGYSAIELQQKLDSMSLTSEEVTKVAEDMGKSYDEVMAMMNDGTLTVKDAQVLLGTTAAESATTIEGSLNTLNAAWQNWLTGLAAEDMDMDKLTDELVASIEIALSNVLPAVQRIGENIITMIAEAFGASDADIQAAFDQIGVIVQTAMGWVVTYVLPVVDQVWNAIKTAVGFIVQVIQAAWPIISLYIEQLALQWQNMLAVVGFVADGISGALNAILPVVQGVLEFFGGAIESARSKVADIVGFVTSRFNFLASQVRFIFNKVKAAITQPIEAAKSAVKRIVDAIKGFFSNFHISLPSIKLPHFSISPSGWQIGDLLKGTIPSLSIQWYAKGGIVDGATLIGAGEAGPEAIVPLSGGYMRPFAAAIADEMGGAATYNIYLNDVAVNDSQGIREVTAAYLLGLKRLAAI